MKINLPFKKKCPPLKKREVARLENMSKNEILEAIYVLNSCETTDNIYESRDQVVQGNDGDRFFEMCEKYKKPLIEFLYSEFYED